MKSVETFDTLEEARIGMKNNPMRSLNQNFIDGKWEITFVSGKDDPDNSIQSLEKRNQFQRLKELKDKLDDDSITFKEFKELERLKER